MIIFENDLVKVDLVLDDVGEFWKAFLETKNGIYLSVVHSEKVWQKLGAKGMYKKWLRENKHLVNTWKEGVVIMNEKIKVLEEYDSI